MKNKILEFGGFIVKMLYTIPNGEIVSYPAAMEYQKNIPLMVEAVNSIMEKLNSADNLIGSNSLSVMQDNHLNHAKFMVSVFKLNDYVLLKNTLNWVLSSYQARGFKKEYFPAEIKAWLKVINKFLEPNYSSGIIIIY